MTHLLKVRAVLSTPSEKRDDGTWLGPRIVQAEFMVPLDGGVQGWHHDSPFPVQTGTFEFQGPDIDALVDHARSQARNELLDDLANMTLQEIADTLRQHAPDLAITDEDW